MSINLPSGWDSYSAADKIDYFNDAGITSSDLLAAGVSQDDINWMSDNGYVYGASAPVSTAIYEPPAGSSYTTSGNITSALPGNWSDFGAQEKINYFNTNQITPDQLMAEGVPRSDIAWMFDNGYTGGGATNTGGTPGSIYTTAGNVTSSLPGNWGTYSPKQKIQYFNDNKITPGQLLSEGVPQADIDWMLMNGYTGGNNVNQVRPKNPIQIDGGQATGQAGGLAGTANNLTGTGQNLGYSQTQYNPNQGAQNQMTGGAYQSNLIQSLRSRNTAPTTNNPGFKLYQTMPVGQNNTFEPPQNGNAFNPQPFEIPEYDPSSLFQEIYGRDPTPKEISSTKGMQPDDLRTTLERSLAEWEAAQNRQNSSPKAPWVPVYDADMAGA